MLIMDLFKHSAEKFACQSACCIPTHAILVSMTDMKLQTDKKWHDHFNLKKICAHYRVSVWQCPQFLFLVMGCIIILAILFTYDIASKFTGPEYVTLIILAMTALLFLIGYLIIGAFDQVASSARSKSEFISIVSHQLRSPLSVIKWNLDVLKSDYVTVDREIAMEDTKKIAEYFETLNYQNERMIRAVNDLLEINRIDDKDIVLRPTSWSLGDLAKKMVERCEKFAAANNVKISFFAQDNLPLVFADEERMKRVIEHLLDNAIRYSIHGGEVVVSIEREDDKIICKITDTGAGISDEDQRRVFGKFFRSSDASRYKTEGSGIGLFVVKSLVEMSGGDVGFSSLLNKGSTFWFALPVKKSL